MGRKHRKSHRKGGGWFGADETGPGPLAAASAGLSKLNPFASKDKPAPVVDATPPALPVVNNAVADAAAPLQTAGKRLKKHIGVNPTSSKDVRRLLKTAKGDKMLGGKRRRTYRRR
jgi:hypothetical protein